MAAALNIVCTSKEAGKGRRVAMAGVPYHSLDHYLRRLLAQRRVIAIAEQMEEAVPNRLVRRDIVRVLTPGTVLEEQFLDPQRNNFLCAVASAAGVTALAAVDVSTATASLSLVHDADGLAAELERLAPAEVIVRDDEDARLCRPLIGDECRIALFDVNSDTASIAPPALEQVAAAERAAAAGALSLLRSYLCHLRLDGDALVAAAVVHETRGSMLLDRATRRHLDLVSGPEHNPSASLLRVLDKTKTAMGGRLLVRWLCAPLLDIAAIEARQERVAALVDAPALRVELQHHLAKVADIERLVQKIHARRAVPPDVAALRRSLASAFVVADLLASHGDPVARSLAGAAAGTDVRAAHDLIDAALLDEPAASLAEGGVIRPQHDAQLAELVSLRGGAREQLLALEAEVRAQTGIKGVKIRYTQAFGYYYEVPRTQVDAVPAHFTRKQSLVNAERFSDSRLAELEHKLLTSRAAQVAREKELFEELLVRLDRLRAALSDCAAALAALDVYCSLAQVAAERRYVRPHIVLESVLEVTAGRHPIVEACGGVDFVPNDCRVDAEHRFFLITGPNMGGKSTYLRQTALISILGQMGSFVPAAEARLGIVDRLFTRIGAGDDIAAGRSTFYVEMAEMAVILRHCTSRSLLLIDEVGRGTGTTDGLAIAQAISEHLLGLGPHLPIVLFATHFHELVALAASYPALVNLHVAVADEPSGPVFSHRVLPGSSNRSYGIAVATMAGLPRSVVARAQEIAAELEGRPPVRARRSRDLPRADDPTAQLEIEWPCPSPDGL